jgi:hypothetical protein
LRLVLRAVVADEIGSHSSPEAHAARAGIGAIPYPVGLRLPGRHQGHEIPAKGHQAVTVGGHGSHGPAIADGVAHLLVLAAERLQQGPFAAERQQLHPIIAEQGRQNALGGYQGGGGSTNTRAG